MGLKRKEGTRWRQTNQNRVVTQKPAASISKRERDGSRVAVYVPGSMCVIVQDPDCSLRKNNPLQDVLPFL